MRVGAASGRRHHLTERIMKNCVLIVLLATLTGCTPQSALLASIVPDGTMSVLLGQTQRVEDTNRRKIVELEQKRDWEGLARFAEDNIKRDAHTPDWWLVAGYAYMEQGKHARAAECYQEAVRLEPDVSAGWTLLAQSYRAAGQPERAARVLNNALLARRDDAQLYWLLGETESDLRRWPSAATAYRAAIKIDEQYVPAWRGLKRAYDESGRAEDAREAQRMLDRLTAEQAAKAKAPVRR
jgi:tetratricopeptide (TPR) repeat protein